MCLSRQGRCVPLAVPSYVGGMSRSSSDDLCTRCSERSNASSEKPARVTADSSAAHRAGTAGVSGSPELDNSVPAPSTSPVELGSDRPCVEAYFAAGWELGERGCSRYGCSECASFSLSRFLSLAEGRPPSASDSQYGRTDASGPIVTTRRRYRCRHSIIAIAHTAMPEITGSAISMARILASGESERAEGVTVGGAALGSCVELVQMDEDDVGCEPSSADTVALKMSRLVLMLSPLLFTVTLSECCRPASKSLSCSRTPSHVRFER